MVEDTGLEPVISLLAKQVQLPLCQSPQKTRCIVRRVCHSATSRELAEMAGLEPARALYPTVIYCCLHLDGGVYRGRSGATS